MSFEIKKLPNVSKNELGRQIFFDDDKSFGLVEEFFVEDGLTCIKSDMYFKENCLFDIVGNSKHIMLNFVLNGEHEYRSCLNKTDINMKKNHTSIIIDNNSIGKKYYKKQTHLKAIQIILEERYYLKILHDFLQNHIFLDTICDNFTKCLALKTTDTHTNLNINDIFYSNPSGINSFFIKSRIFEVLYAQLSTITHKKSQDHLSIKFSSYDIEALNYAKEILINQMQNPPSIHKLSRQIKLNEFKLKTGFKIFFKTSPYKFLFNYKMNYAKNLLQKGELSISEISKKVGFKHPANFTTAFKANFKINPKDILKK